MYAECLGSEISRVGGAWRAWRAWCGRVGGRVGIAWDQHLVGGRAAAPGMRANPLVNDGDASVLVELQLLPGGLKPHHLGQQPFQLFLLCKAKESC